jgi:hypothetical protein
MPACHSHLPFSRWREPCCCRGLELRSRFTVQGCIGAAQQMSYHLDHSVGADRPRRRTAQGGHLRERRRALFSFSAKFLDSVGTLNALQALLWQSGHSAPTGRYLPKRSLVGRFFFTRTSAGADPHEPPVRRARAGRAPPGSEPVRDPGHPRRCGRGYADSDPGHAARPRADRSGRGRPLRPITSSRSQRDRKLSGASMFRRRPAGRGQEPAEGRSPARRMVVPSGAQETDLIRNAAHEQAEAVRLASCYEAPAIG